MKIYDRDEALNKAKETGKLVSCHCCKTGILDHTYGPLEEFDLNDTYSIYYSGMIIPGKAPWVWPSDLPGNTMIKLVHNTMTDSTYYSV